MAQSRPEGLNRGKRRSQWRGAWHPRYGSSPSKGLTAGKHLCVQSCRAKHGLGGCQHRLRTACGTATRQQVPSRTSNGHSRQHKGGSELSGAATLSPIHSPRDPATALAPGPTAGPPALTRHLHHTIEPRCVPDSRVARRVPGSGVSWPEPPPSLSDNCQGSLRPQCTFALFVLPAAPRSGGHCDPFHREGN